MNFLRIAACAAMIHLIATGARAAGPDEGSNWETCVQSSDLDRKIAACTAIVEQGEEVSRERRSMALAFRANGYSARKDFDAALTDASEAVRLDSENALAFNNRGAAYLGKGEAAAAIADLSESIRLDPGNAYTYNNRGLAYTRTGDFDLAIQDLNEAIRLRPELANPYRHRGTAWRGKGDYDKALADFETALRINPNYGDALLGRAETFAARGDHERALVDYEVALRVATAYGKPDLRSSAEEGIRTERGVISGRRPALPSADRSRREEIRRALVIGNATYKAHRVLLNPKRDAEAIAASLRGSGFEVEIAFDLGRKALIDALNSFADKAVKSDWAVIYFAGHGIEVDRTNYIIPVDATLARDRDVQDEAISLDRVLQAVQGARRMRLVVLDACRDNPFVTTMQSTRTTRSIGRGLARVAPAAGTLVAYAARAGQVAEDGENGKNSPFAAALATRIAEPDVELGMVFRHVRDDVMKATGNRQEPFVYGSLPGDTFYFRQSQSSLFQSTGDAVSRN